MIRSSRVRRGRSLKLIYNEMAEETGLLDTVTDVSGLLFGAFGNPV